MHELANNLEAWGGRVTVSCCSTGCPGVWGRVYWENQSRDEDGDLMG